MFALNLGQLNINEAELKAYIYQQLNDIQPYIGNATVAIKMAYTEEDQFIVKMIFNHHAGAIEAESSEPDIFNAISKAKTTLIKNMHSLNRALEDEGADAPISNHEEKKIIH